MGMRPWLMLRKLELFGRHDNIMTPERLLVRRGHLFPELIEYVPIFFRHGFVLLRREHRRRRGHVRLRAIVVRHDDVRHWSLPASTTRRETVDPERHRCRLQRRMHDWDQD